MGFLISALAIAILYFCPPDNLTPLSPTIVLSPSGNNEWLFTNSEAFAMLKALSTSIDEQSSTPYFTLSSIDPQKREGS